MTLMNTETETERIGNTAPDWGRNYGITELWSEVAPGLFVGGTHDDDTIDRARPSSRGFGFQVLGDAEIGPEEFDAVVTLYAWARPVDWDVEELRWGIGDSEGREIDMEALKDTVVWTHRKWSVQNKKTLVRCQAGLNRSSLVAALVLVREGVAPAMAIKAIRGRRSPKCLFNKKFERLILTTPVEFWRRGL